MEVTDQMDRVVELPEQPKRIISLVPSQTQLLYELGLGDSVVGITKFCIHPEEWFRTKERVGGTKALNIEKIKSLNPDLILGNKEENTKEDIEQLEKVAPVWMSDIYTLEDAKGMIRSVAKITGKEPEGEALLTEISGSFQRLRKNELWEQNKGKTVLYYIWNEPAMVAGRNTFVDAMLSECGWVNWTNEDRYPAIEKAEPNPDFVFLSSEPFPFKQEHLQLFQEKFPDSEIVLVDGEAFSWYGSMLKDAPGYFEQLLKQFAG